MMWPCTFRPRKMLERHNPPESYGDCWRTCLAMAMDIDQLDVPHFGNDQLYPIVDDAGRKAEQAWLAGMGWARIAIPMYGGWGWDYVAGVLNQQSPQAVVVVTGKSPRGDWNHDVVWRGGRLLDPFTGEDGDLDGPAIDTNVPEAQWYWLNILTPSLTDAEE